MSVIHKINAKPGDKIQIDFGSGDDGSGVIFLLVIAVVVIAILFAIAKLFAYAVVGPVHAVLLSAPAWIAAVALVRIVLWLIASRVCGPHLGWVGASKLMNVLVVLATVLTGSVAAYNIAFWIFRVSPFVPRLRVMQMSGGDISLIWAGSTDTSFWMARAASIMALLVMMRSKPLLQFASDVEASQ